MAEKEPSQGYQGFGKHYRFSVKLPFAAPNPKKLLSRWNQWQFPSSYSKEVKSLWGVPLRKPWLQGIGITYPWRKTVLTFLTRVNHHRTHLQTEKNQTKTPLKELTNFSSTECIFTQLQTSKQKPNPAWETVRWEFLPTIPRDFLFHRFLIEVQLKGEAKEDVLKGRISFGFYKCRADGRKYLSSSHHPDGCSSVRGLIQLLLTCRRHRGAQTPREILNIICLLIIANFRK